jgi:Meckel syndrome type 1 protein
MTTPLPPDPMHNDELPGEAELKASFARLPQSEPGPALDAAIRQAAAQALRENASSARRRPRWPIALGTAATLVLAAGLAWRMRESPSPSAAAPSPAAIAADAQRMREAAVQDKAAEPAAATEPVPTMKATTSTPAGGATPKSLPLRQMRRMPAALAPSASKRAATSPEASRTATALPYIDRSMPAAANATEALKAPAPPAPPSLEEIATPSAPQAAGAAQPAPAPLAAPAPPADLPAAAANPAKVTATQPFSMNPAAAKEFDAIRALYAKGERTAARRRLEAVHREHPDWPLPDDLRAHLDDAP